MKLHLYLARRFAMTFTGLFVVFFLFQALIDLIDQVRKLNGTEAGFSDMLAMAMLIAPYSVFSILPLIMILATVAMFLSLARSSELVVIRAVGRSGLIALAAPVMTALLIGLLAVSMFNPIVAATSKRYDELLQSWRNSGQDVLSISAEGLWLRQGGPEGQTVIRASSANPDATVLYDVTFLTYAPEGGPLRRIEARQAALGDGAWQMRGVKLWALSEGTNPEANAAMFDRYELTSTLTHERLRESFGTANAISVWDLPRFIAQLDQAGFSTRRHSVWLQIELARPLFLVSMVLLGAAFTMRHARFGRTGVAVLASLLLGFSLYYIRNFAQILGENGQIPVMLAAWAPPIAAMLLAMGVLLHMEDG